MTRLADLDPRWLVHDGKRVGFIFVSPTNPQWFQSCLTAALGWREQHDLFNAALPEFGEHAWTKVQGCSEGCAWTVAGGIENASFDALTVTPSIDGSKGGLWHGFITNGQIV